MNLGKGPYTGTNQIYTHLYFLFVVRDDFFLAKADFLGAAEVMDVLGPAELEELATACAAIVRGEIRRVTIVSAGVCARFVGPVRFVPDDEGTEPVDDSAEAVPRRFTWRV
jgi:hypothetical protein